jgi:hypothetical protein
VSFIVRVVLCAMIVSALCIICVVCVYNKTHRPSDRRLSAKLVPTFAYRRMSHGQCGGSPTAVISVL